MNLEEAWQQVIKSHHDDIWLMITGEQCAYFSKDEPVCGV